MTREEMIAVEAGLELLRDESGLYLKKDDLIVRGDFSKMIPRLRTSNLNGELLVKAAKIKEEKKEYLAIDATAGMGEDSILLAAAGFHVLMYEYNPVICALLQDACDRAKEVPELAAIVSRMEVVNKDSVEALKHLNEAPDVVYLDPMFPQRQKSGLIKKKFQLLQKLEKPCAEDEGEQLLLAALGTKAHKVVIKRPLKGPFLAGIKPGFSIEGKAIRYDCIVQTNK